MSQDDLAVELAAITVELTDHGLDELGEGPAVERGGPPSSWSDDLAQDERWPTWGPAVARKGSARCSASGSCRGAGASVP